MQKVVIAPAGQFAVDPSLAASFGQALTTGLLPLLSRPDVQANLAREAGREIAKELKPAMYILAGSVAVIALASLIRAVR